MKTSKVIKQQIGKLAREEAKHLNKKEGSYLGDMLQDKLAPVKQKIADKTPDKMIDTFTQAFEKGFYAVFEQGTGLIEKSFNAQKPQQAFSDSEQTRVGGNAKQALKQVDWQAKKSALKNQSITTVEGTVLGVLGIGLPDIPIYLAMLVKAVYETCLSYGFSYESTAERIFILHLIAAAASKGEDKRHYAELADRVGSEIDEGTVANLDYDATIADTAAVLASQIVTAKVIQGIPLLGATGGVSNYILLQELNKIAKLKYKKRYLHKQQ